MTAVQALAARPARGQASRAAVHLVEETADGFLGRAALCGATPLHGFTRAGDEPARNLCARCDARRLR